MTMRTARWLSCDVDDCESQSGDGSLGDSSAAYVRLDATRDGWHRSRGRDVCPECWEAGKR